MLKGKTVVLGVSSSIAAYKIANLASMLVKQHANVRVIMTQNATNFITPTTFETLTGQKCLVDTFDRNFEFQVEHVSLAKQADIFMIAPATANVIAKVSHGLADDMLTTTVPGLQGAEVSGPGHEYPDVRESHHSGQLKHLSEIWHACDRTGQRLPGLR